MYIAHIATLKRQTILATPNNSTSVLMELQAGNSRDAPKPSSRITSYLAIMVIIGNLPISSMNNVRCEFHLEMTLINRLIELNTPMTLFISDGDSSDCSSVPPNILCKIEWRQFIFFYKCNFLDSKTLLLN